MNDKEAAKKATHYLYNTGCRNIIFLSTIHGTSVGNRRENGYNEAMKSLGITAFSVYMENYLCFEETLIKVLKEKKVDAVLASDELSAISVIKNALKHKYKIPEQLSVIGFTNGIMAENFVPSLTTVEQHAEEQGALAAEIMIKRIEKKLAAPMVQEILDTTIVERESTLPVKNFNPVI
ncbi:substrate-binding domain-containing protein [Antarcticibacterium sp. 1MA-6-2]|uniref:LacI family DNA-binding transcriptional regulator n=1 Tax=Antarcticibacterium sp. 1MA-6-2 TaxID=2908210 RepID=UPI001F442345|nr:substrate-binding domain-containing protein [Antarcticibacterium sp. 1MA-6-2]UJH93028.1 substrate-binding domain-containing protein [Antarcticibacterium sp. 1MA-6-2]